MPLLGWPVPFIIHPRRLHIVLPRLDLICSRSILLVGTWANNTVIALFLVRGSVAPRASACVGRWSLIIPKLFKMSDWHWRMSYRRGRLSRPLRRLHTRAPCFPDCPNSLTSHRAGASLHLSVDRFSLGHLCLIPPARCLFSGPTSSPFFGCLRQLAVSLGQYTIQPYYL